MILEYKTITQSFGNVFPLNTAKVDLYLPLRQFPYYWEVGF